MQKVWKKELQVFDKEVTTTVELEAWTGIFKDRMEDELKRPTPGPVKGFQIDLSPSVFMNGLWSGHDEWKMKTGYVLLVLCLLIVVYY